MLLAYSTRIGSLHFPWLTAVHSAQMKDGVQSWQFREAVSTTRVRGVCHSGLLLEPIPQYIQHLGVTTVGLTILTSTVRVLR